MPKGNIIVVHEDMQSLARAMSSLTQKGFEVVGAKDGADAFKKLESGVSDVAFIAQDGGRAALVVFTTRGKAAIAMLCPLAPVLQPIELRPEALRRTMENLLAARDSLLENDAGIVKQVVEFFTLHQEISKLTGDLLPKLGKMSGAENAYLVLRDRSNNLILKESWGPGAIDPSVVLRIAEIAARQSGALLALDGTTPVAEAAQEITNARISSLIVTPLTTGKALMGFLAAINTTPGKTFKQPDSYLLSLFGLELSPVLEGERMKDRFDELVRSTGELRTQVEQRQREISALNNLIQSLNTQKQALQEHLEAVQARHSTTAKTVVSLLEKDEDRLQGHAEQVAKWTMALGEALGINLEDLPETCYFHHIGALPRARALVSLPETAGKTGSATDNFPLVGEKLAEMMQLPTALKQAIRHQRENFDGSGYPDQLSGDSIPLASRLLRVTCAYVDLVSEQSGRPVLKPGEVLAHFREGASRAYDPRVIEAFLKLVTTEKDSPDVGALSTISHELRSPLTYLMGYSELLSTHKELPQEARQAAQEISTEATHMARILESLSDISRFEVGKAQLSLVDADMSRLVLRSVAKAKERAGSRQIETELPANAGRVKADPDKITQVLDNLLNNAINYSPDGTKITVRVTLEKSDLVTSISDQGIGIPRDKLGNLFKKYYRVDSVLKDKVKGMGIGLNLCKYIVEAHGGRIWVESEEGRGSTFCFSLPLPGT